MIDIAGELMEIFNSKQHHCKRKVFYFLLFPRRKITLLIILKCVDDSDYGNTNKCSHLKNKS